MRLRKSSLLVAAVGALALTAAFVPVANGATSGLQVYFNFNGPTYPDNAPPPYTSVPVGTYGSGEPFQQTTLDSDATNPFPGGQLVIDSSAGTTTNQFPADLSGAGGALDVMGNNQSAGAQYCFDIGSFSTVGLSKVSLSFAIQATGGSTGGRFTTLDLGYGTNGTTFTHFDTIAINQDGNFHIITDSLPNDGTVNEQSTFFLQFCFSGATNASGHVFVDNIQVNAVVPEPSTYIGGLLGLLGVLGLYWYQRQLLMRGLSFRRA